DDLAVGEAGCLHGTSSEKDTRKFHFWRLLLRGGITVPAVRLSSVNVADGAKHELSPLDRACLAAVYLHLVVQPCV
ncbi:hypothetical protein, partial [Xanthomonas arboricola]